MNICDLDSVCYKTFFCVYGFFLKMIVYLTALRRSYASVPPTSLRAHAVITRHVRLTTGPEVNLKIRQKGLIAQNVDEQLGGISDANRSEYEYSAISVERILRRPLEKFFFSMMWSNQIWRNVTSANDQMSDDAGIVQNTVRILKKARCTHLAE